MRIRYVVVVWPPTPTLRWPRALDRIRTATSKASGLPERSPPIALCLPASERSLPAPSSPRCVLPTTVREDRAALSRFGLVWSSDLPTSDPKAPFRSRALRLPPETAPGSDCYGSGDLRVLDLRTPLVRSCRCPRGGPLFVEGKDLLPVRLHVYDRPALACASSRPLSSRPIGDWRS